MSELDANSEVRALKARVARLEAAISGTIDALNASGIKNAGKFLDGFLSETPQQSLAEIEAAAVEKHLNMLADEYAKHGGLQFKYSTFDISQHIYAQAKYYANQLRQND